MLRPPCEMPHRPETRLPRPQESDAPETLYTRSILLAQRQPNQYPATPANPRTIPCMVIDIAVVSSNAGG